MAIQSGLGNIVRGLGRAGLVAGLGIAVIDTYRNYAKNIESEPSFKEMQRYRAMQENVSSAISCLGREPFEEKDFGSFHEGGAINELYRKKTLSEPPVVIPADKDKAMRFILQAASYTLKSEDLIGMHGFEERKQTILERLQEAHETLKRRKKNFVPAQRTLSDAVNELKVIEGAYQTAIYDCQKKVERKSFDNAAYALGETLTFGYIKKDRA